MAETDQYTIDQFYRFISEGRLMAVKCNSCGKQTLPPRQICPECHSENLEWIQIGTEGRILTYTIIYIPPKGFEDMAPYAYGIIELEGNIRLPGIIRDVDLDDLKVGMKVEVCFDRETSDKWPNWPRYYFRPVES